MANVVANVGRKFVLDTTHGTGTYILGDTSDGVVGTFAVHIVNTGSLSASIVVKARNRDAASLFTADAVPFVAWHYLSAYVNGAAGDWSMITTAITTTSNILIPASGQQIALDVTYTSGTGAIYVTPLDGAAI